MSYEDYIKELFGLKSNAENQIIASIGDIENDVVNALMQWVDSSLDTKGGNLVASEETIKILNDFDSNYRRVMLQLSSYKVAVTSYLKELKPIGSVIGEFQKAANGIDIAAAGVGESQKLVVNEILSAYTDNGLNAKFIQPLRDILYRNISTGANVSDTKQALSSYIKGGKDESGKLDRYLTQTAQQGVDSYTGIINKKLMDTFDYNALIMSGSLIDTSSKQCKYGINILGGMITKKSFEKDIKPIAEKNGLAKGTTFENLPFNKLHWACRHEFTPMFAKEGDVIGKDEVVKDGKILKMK